MSMYIFYLNLYEFRLIEVWRPCKIYQSKVIRANYHTLTEAKTSLIDALKVIVT